MLTSPFSMIVWSLVVVFGYALVERSLKNRANERKEKLRILEDALRNDRLDQATRDDVLEALTGRRPGRSATKSAVSGSAHWMFVLGWLGLFVGVAMLVGFDSELGLAVTIAAAGLLTLPLAMRELHGSRRTT